MSYAYPDVGAVYRDGMCSFTVWAPEKTKVELLLNNVRFSLRKDERGYWSASVPCKAGAEYFFLVDDQKLPDPASRSQLKGVHGPSVVTDRNFEWQSRDWKGLPLSELVMYELHVGTFTNHGTFDGVISKLNYLKDLGVNAIELLPVAQFPGSRNWGYDGVYPFAVQDSYGGGEGLKRLVDAAHQNGIAVILDVVYNHLGPEGNYLGAYAPYFTDKYKTGWGQALNFDDAYCDGVRNYFWQNARMWLDEFRIDGLRLDAVHAIWDFSARHFIAELVDQARSIEKSSGSKKVLIAEFDLNNPRYINEKEKGGYGLDGQWIDEYHHALHAVVTGEVDGYYEDFGKVSHLQKAIRDTYVYTGEYSIHRKKNFGVVTENSYDQFIVFAQNHDQVGNRMLGDRLTKTLSHDKLRLAAAAYILSPHVPMLFMGEEYGETNPFQYFISHTDENLVKLVREGRKKEFSYFKWEGEVPDPQSEKTFQECKLSWQTTASERAALLSFYKAIISLRKTHAAYRDTSRASVRMIDTNHDEVIAFEKKGPSSIIVILNFGKSAYTPSWKMNPTVLIDSASQEWGGTMNNAFDKQVVQPNAAVVVENRL